VSDHNCPECGAFIPELVGLPTPVYLNHDEETGAHTVAGPVRLVTVEAEEDAPIDPRAVLEFMTSLLPPAALGRPRSRRTWPHLHGSDGYDAPPDNSDDE